MRTSTASSSTTADATLDFACCDTTWRIRALGADAESDARRAQATVQALARRLNAFDPASAVARLNREGEVRDEHVARLVRRADAYRARTRGAFDVARGALEHAIKRHIREGGSFEPASARASVTVSRDVVRASAPLDLNGIAKGYIVDAARAQLRDGFVDGGGDIATPTGPVAIDAPDGSVMGYLDTRWNVATSGGSKRKRGAVDHLYDPRSGRVGARHEQVTVVARRDCVEADVLATTLTILPLDEGLDLVASWDGVEALWLAHGQRVASEGFANHVWSP